MFVFHVVMPTRAFVMFCAGCLELVGILGQVCCIRTWIGPNVVMFIAWWPVMGVSAWLHAPAQGVKLIIVIIAVSAAAIVCHLGKRPGKPRQRRHTLHMQPQHVWHMSHTPPCSGDPLPHTVAATCHVPDECSCPRLLLGQTCEMGSHGP